MKNHSKMLCAVLAVYLLFSAAVPALADEANEPSDWAADQVKGAIAWRLVPQELQGDYQTAMTRGEFAKMSIYFLASEYDYPTLWANDVYDETTMKDFVCYFLENSQTDGHLRYSKEDFLGDVPEALGEEARNSSWRELLTLMAPFSESSDPGKADDFFYIHAAYVLGIVNGRDDGTFGPDDPITRQEAAAMLDRVHHVYAAIPLYEAALTQYTDQDEIGDWAKSSVARMVRYAIMIGTSADTFSPCAYYTREQGIITFLRLFDSYFVKELNPDILYPTPMDAKLAKVYHFLSVYNRNRWDTDDAIVITGVSTVGTMGGHLDTTHLYILYRSDGKEDIHISNSADVSLSEDEQYVYYRASRDPNWDPEPYRIHIQTGEIEEV